MTTASMNEFRSPAGQVGVRANALFPALGHPNAAHLRGEAELAVRPPHQLGLLSPLMAA
jgi:hypothetical protein